MLKNRVRELREKKGTAQSTLAKKLSISITEVYAIENNDDDNILYENNELIEKVCKFFSIEKKDVFLKDTKNEDAFYLFHTAKGNDIRRVIFLDTSFILDNSKLTNNYLREFEKICIAKTVMEELNSIKDRRADLRSDKARWALNSIGKLKDNVELEFGKEEGSNPDNKIFCAASNYAKDNPNIKVFFLSHDAFHKAKKSSLKNLIITNEEEIYERIDQFKKTYDLEETEMFWKYLEKNNFKSIERMNLSKVDINGIYKNNYNPLCYSIMNKMNEIIRILFYNSSIDLNVSGSEPKGYGPLHCIIEMNNVKLFNDFVNDSRVYLNLLTKNTTNNGVTPLMVASLKGNINIVKTLTNKISQQNHSLNQQDSLGQTALHKAMIKNKKESYQILAKYIDEKIIDLNYNMAYEYEKKPE